MAFILFLAIIVLIYYHYKTLNTEIYIKTVFNKEERDASF